jgi:hypothetical protein
LKLRHFAAAAVVCASVSSCSTSTSTPPPPPPTPAQLLAEASASDFTCTRANATASSFEKFLANARVNADKCVRITGLATFRFVVKDAATMPQQKNAAIPNSAIGLYWKDDGMRKLDAGPQFVEIVGRVRLCAARDKLEQAAGVSSALTPCHTAAIAIFASQSRVFPTAMD